MEEVVRKIILAEDALELAFQRPKIIPDARKLFSDSLMNELQDLLISEGVGSLEMMELAGYIDEAQRTELIIVDPAYKQARKELLSLSRRIANTVPDKSIDIALERIAGKNPSFKKLEDLLLVIERVKDTMEAPVLPDSDQLPNVKLRFMHDCVTWVQAILYFRIMKRLVNGFDKTTSNLFRSYLNRMNDFSVAQTGLSHPGYSLTQVIAGYYQVTNNHTNSINQLLTPSDTSTEDTEIGNELMFDEIEDLAFYRTVTQTVEYKNSTIIIVDTRDGVPQEKRTDDSNVCFVRVTFDPNDKEFIKYSPTQNCMIVTPSHAAIELQISRDGELTPIGFAGILITDLEVLTKDQYEALRGILFKILLNKLRTSPNNVSSTLDGTNPRHISKKIQDDMVDAMFHSERSSSNSNSDSQIPTDPEEVDFENDELKDLTDVYHVEDSANTSSSLPLPRGLQASKVIRVITNILGQEPKRVSGSHCIFKSRSGGTYPVPNHGSKTLGVGLLSKALRHLGISREEFIEKI